MDLTARKVRVQLINTIGSSCGTQRGENVTSIRMVPVTGTSKFGWCLDGFHDQCASPSVTQQLCACACHPTFDDDDKESTC